MNKIIKPNFLCVGAQKAGTTTLHDILQQHPDIYLPESKEAHFFDMDEHYKRGLNWWSETFFSKHNHEKIIGAMTPEYLYYHEVPLRILNTLGKDLKIIMILRNPVNRAYSHYQMSQRRSYEKKDFFDAIKLEKERISKGEFERHNFSYIDRGLYCEQVKRYIDLFGEDKVLVISFENELLSNINKTIKKVQDFLEIKPYPLNVNTKSNTAHQARFSFLNRIIFSENILKKMARKIISSSILKITIAKFIYDKNKTKSGLKKLTSQQKAEIMNSYFIEDVKKLENLLQRDFSYWYKTWK